MPHAVHLLQTAAEAATPHYGVAASCPDVRRHAFIRSDAVSRTRP